MPLPKRPLVEDAQPGAVCLAKDKFPKSVELPVFAIVTYSIMFEYASV